MGNENITPLGLIEVALETGLEVTAGLLLKAREENPLIYDSTAMAVRGMITASVRKGYSHVGGREAVDGLRNDLLQFGVLTITDPHRLDSVLDKTYDSAYAVGMEAKESYRNIEAEWRIELFKAICEANTLRGIFVEEADMPTEGTETSEE